MPFKVGDQVKCIDDGGYGDVKVGEIYTVTFAATNGISVASTKKWDYYNERFILVKPYMNGAEEYEEAMLAQDLMTRGS